MSKTQGANQCDTLTDGKAIEMYQSLIMKLVLPTRVMALALGVFFSNFTHLTTPWRKV